MQLIIAQQAEEKAKMEAELKAKEDELEAAKRNDECNEIIMEIEAQIEKNKETKL